MKKNLLISLAILTIGAGFAVFLQDSGGQSGTHFSRLGWYRDGDNLIANPTGASGTVAIRTNATDRFNIDADGSVITARDHSVSWGVYRTGGDKGTPPEGESFLWYSNGVGWGDAGDLVMTTTQGGQTRNFILNSFSSETADYQAFGNLHYTGANTGSSYSLSVSSGVWTEVDIPSASLQLLDSQNTDTVTDGRIRINFASNPPPDGALNGIASVTLSVDLNAASRRLDVGFGEGGVAPTNVLYAFQTGGSHTSSLIHSSGVQGVINDLSDQDEFSIFVRGNFTGSVSIYTYFISLLVE